MAIDLPVVGQQNWGEPLNGALRDMDVTRPGSAAEAALALKADKTDVYSRAETGAQITNAITASRPPLYGTGFPNGVVAAPVGTLYSDNAVTNGASLWQKVSGTGNTGWEVVRGDTGERDVRALLAAPFRVSAGPAFHASLSRENGFVQLGLRVEVIASVAVGRTTVLTLPTGFTIPRYGVKGAGSVIRAGVERPVTITSLAAEASIDISGEPLAVGDILSAQIVGRTRTAWPTGALPGTN